MVDLKTKEEFIKNIKEFIAENRYGLKVIGIAGAFFCIGMPLIMNFAYIFGRSHAIFVTAWDAADMLSYYGTLLGAVATIIAVTWTIIYSRKSAEKDRNNSQNIAHREFGVRLCLELIDACDYNKVYDLFISLQHKEKDFQINSDEMFDIVSIEIKNILTIIDKNINIFYIYYPKLKNSTT